MFAMTTEVVLWFVTWNHDSVCQIRSLSYKIRDKGTQNQMLGMDSLKTKDTAQKFFFICLSVVLIVSVPRPLCIKELPTCQALRLSLCIRSLIICRYYFHLTVGSEMLICSPSVTQLDSGFNSKQVLS